MLLCHVLYVFRMFYGASQSRSPVCFIIGCFSQGINLDGFVQYPIN